jgi:hypothetical protein
MLGAVLQRPEMRGRFANTFSDLIDGVCSPENATAVFDTLIAKIQPEHEYAIEAGLFDDIGNPATSPSVRIQTNRESIREYILHRPERMLDMIGLPWNAPYNSGLGFARNNRRPLTVTTSTGGGAVMNSRIISENETVTGNYYSGTSVTVTAKPYPDYSVSHWIVGGNRIDAVDRITVDITSASPEIQLHFVKNGDAELRIRVISATGGDWLEIHNPSDTAFSAKGLFLTDNSNRFRFQMPTVIFRPGGSVVFKSRSNSDTVTPKRCQTNFNFSFRETLRLSSADGRVLQAADVTLLKRNQVQRLGRDGNWTLSVDN